MISSSSLISKCWSVSYSQFSLWVFQLQCKSWCLKGPHQDHLAELIPATLREIWESEKERERRANEVEIILHCLYIAANSWNTLGRGCESKTHRHICLTVSTSRLYCVCTAYNHFLFLFFSLLLMLAKVNTSTNMKVKWFMACSRGPWVVSYT